MTVYSTCRNCGDPLKDAEFYFCSACVCPECDGFGEVEIPGGQAECHTCWGTRLNPNRRLKT